MVKPILSLWIALVGAIVAIGCMALFWVNQRRRSAETRVEVVLSDRLSPYNAQISKRFETYAISLRRAFENADLQNSETCLQLKREPIVKSLVVVSEAGQLSYPSSINGLSVDDLTLIDEAKQLLIEMQDPRPSATQQSQSQALNSYRQSAIVLDDAALNQQTLQPQAYPGESPFDAPLPDLDVDAQLPVQTNASNSPEPSTAPQEELTNRFGWITWYHRRSLVLGFWWIQESQPDEQQVAVRLASQTTTKTYGLAILPTARWMSDLVADLPDAEPLRKTTSENKQTMSEQAPTAVGKPASLSGVINQLVDVEGNTIYQWGNATEEFFDRIPELQPQAEIEVVKPFEGWRLRTYATPQLIQVLQGDPLIWPLSLGVVGVAAALIMMGVLVTGSIRRELVQARRRVSFVNQVSHELRTPLTNIRMYTELIRDNIANSDEPWLAKEAERLEIIHGESERLSRLITNVLQFAKKDHIAKMEMRPTDLGRVLKDTIHSFSPRLNEAGLELTQKIDSLGVRSVNADAIEQILVNLISNAEKYGNAGKSIDISATGDSDVVTIEVRDYGLGVPPSLKAKIFEPFTRASNRLEAPAGTGIGLTITRNLAIAHGGDCVLIDSDRGALFRVTISAPLKKTSS